MKPWEFLTIFILSISLSVGGYLVFWPYADMLKQAINGAIICIAVSGTWWGVRDIIIKNRQDG